MKKLYIFVAIAIFAMASYAQQANTSTEEFAIAEWNTLNYKLGKITQKPVTVEFKCKNIGSIPLQIMGVTRTHDCSIPEWTVKPIQPGQTGMIKVTFDPKVTGEFNKVIKVKANVKEEIIELTISGEVIPEAKLGN